jgi:tetratricopeptide (TPR) repeat protein
MPATEAQSQFPYDVFISHASEDKVAFVDDLVKVLHERGLRVWYDSFEIKLGDDFRRKMEQGLLGSRFGVVVVSPSFLQAWKHWPQQELSALFNLEAVDGGKRILPVLYGVSWQTLTRNLPLLATRRAVDVSAGVDTVADQIHAVVQGAAVVPSRPTSRLFGVPLPSQSFVGRREELEQLKQALSGADVRVCAAVEGLPGIGKTELVLKLAHELAAAGEFPGGIFWLPAESPDLIAAWANDDIAGALGAVGETPRERALNAVSMLSRREARVLVILDNVEAWDKISQPAPLPNGPKVTLLVTTRKSHLGGNRFRAFELKFLGPAEARALVTGLAGADVATRPGFQDLLDFLDGHALAVELAGVFLREYPEVSPAAYLADLKAGRDLAAKLTGETRYEASVSQSFALLWQRLDKTVQRAWQLASWFAPEPASAALADACGLDSDARHALHRHHLVDLDRDGRFRMHRLTRAFGQGAGDEDAQRSARRAFLDGVEARARMIDIAAGFRIYAPDRAHFEAALELTSEEGDATRRSDLLDRIGRACRSMGEMARARDLFEEALALDIKDLGEEHQTVAVRRSGLAIVLQDLGELPRARELHERALASGIKNLGEDDPEVAIRRSNLATVLQDLGEPPRARELLEQALASDIKNLGQDHPSVAIRRSNLATVLQGLGELPRARELLEQALASDIKNLGQDHPSVARRRSNLALVLHDLGELPRARELLEQALASDIKNLGQDHPNVAIRRSNLALVLQDLGESPRARELLEQALASDIKNLGQDHPKVATWRYNLALVHEQEGDLPAALGLLREALRSELVCLGAAHPSPAMTRAKIASLLFRLGDRDEASKEAREALRVVSVQPEGSRYRKNVEALTKAIVS